MRGALTIVTAIVTAAALLLLTRHSSSATAWNLPGTFLTSLAVDNQGDVYMTDDYRRILKLGTTGKTITEWGKPHCDDNIQAVAVDRHGSVYMLSVSCIEKRSPQGKILAQWRVPTPHTSIAVDTQGNLYLAFDSDSHIQKLALSGKPIAQWDVPATDHGGRVGIHGLAVDQQGCIYGTVSQDQRGSVSFAIVRLSRTGRLLARWGKRGTGVGQFQDPTGLAVDEKGNIYVADTGNSRIQELSPAGTWLAQWGGDGSDLFRVPRAVALHGGAIYVVDFDNHRIQMLPHES